MHEKSLNILPRVFIYCPWYDGWAIGTVLGGILELTGLGDMLLAEVDSTHGFSCCCSGCIA
jgi:hypothetical protein